MSAPHAQPKYIRVNQWIQFEPSKPVNTGLVAPESVSPCKLKAYGWDEVNFRDVFRILKLRCVTSKKLEH